MACQGPNLPVTVIVLIGFVLLCQLHCGSAASSHKSKKYTGCKDGLLDNRYQFISRRLKTDRIKGTIKIKMEHSCSNWSMLVCFRKPTCMIHWWKSHRREFHKTSVTPDSCYTFFSKPGQGVEVGKKLVLPFLYNPIPTAEEGDYDAVPKYVTLMCDSVQTIDPPTYSLYNDPSPNTPELTDIDHGYCAVCPNGNHAALGSCGSYVKCKNGAALLKDCSYGNTVREFYRPENKCQSASSATACASQSINIVCMHEGDCPSTLHIDICEFGTCGESA